MLTGARAEVVDKSGNAIHNAVLRFDSEIDDFHTFSDGYMYRILPEGEHTVHVAAHGWSENKLAVFSCIVL